MQILTGNIDCFDLCARYSLHQDANAAIGKLQHSHNHGDGADFVEIVLLRFFLIEIFLACQKDHPVLAQRFIHRTD